MARINLLPWRVERRKLRKKEFLTMLGLSAIAGVVLWFLLNMYYNNQISGENARNDYLHTQISQVDSQIKEIDELDKKKAKLLARKQVIEQLQANRSQMVHLFDSLVRTIPDGVILTSIKQEGDKLTLEGRSQSNARVSTYMRNLEGSGWMNKPDLSIIEATAGDPALPYAFTLSVMLVNPNAPKDSNGDGVPDAPGVTPAAPAPAAGATVPATTPAPAQSAAPATTPATPAPAAPASGGSAS
ncbi:PilN domain-containing protein [Cognatiluteimonas profundi]|uniref:PilN domain-containing protein n=1 Tax=Cognatiluteimonas profundi TaxID=2594501 RepID=UPI00131D70F3|nr:PilN domain-containing protein [Lysobacter profundi]